MTTEHVFPQAMQAGDLAVAEGGLSLRDYFAAKVMQALLGDQSVTELDVNGYAEWSYKYADAMIRARQQPATTN